MEIPDDAKQVPGHEGIYASPQGDIFSTRGEVPCKLSRRQSNNISGMFFVRFGRRVNGRKIEQSHSIARLVLEAFIGPCPPGHRASHKNRDKTDSRLCNVEWKVPTKIYQATKKGEDSPSAKLSMSEVIEIKGMRADGMGYKRIARIMGLPPSRVRWIIHGPGWKQLEGITPPPQDKA